MTDFVFEILCSSFTDASMEKLQEIMLAHDGTSRALNNHCFQCVHECGGTGVERGGGVCWQWGWVSCWGRGAMCMHMCA